MTTDQQVKNLERLKIRKEKHIKALQTRLARKNVQIRTIKNLHFQIKVERAVTDIKDLPVFLSREIDREIRDRDVIMEDLKTLKS